MKNNTNKKKNWSSYSILQPKSSTCTPSPSIPILLEKKKKKQEENRSNRKYFFILVRAKKKKKRKGNGKRSIEELHGWSSDRNGVIILHSILR